MININQEYEKSERMKTSAFVTFPIYLSNINAFQTVSLCSTRLFLKTRSNLAILCWKSRFRGRGQAPSPNQQSILLWTSFVSSLGLWTPALDWMSLSRYMVSSTILSILPSTMSSMMKVRSTFPLDSSICPAFTSRSIVSSWRLSFASKIWSKQISSQEKNNRYLSALKVDLVEPAGDLVGRLEVRLDVHPVVLQRDLTHLVVRMTMVAEVMRMLMTVVMRMVLTVLKWINAFLCCQLNSIRISSQMSKVVCPPCTCRCLSGTRSLQWTLSSPQSLWSGGWRQGGFGK